MPRKLSHFVLPTCLCGTLLMMLGGCSSSDKERANEHAAEAKEKTRVEAERLKTDAQKLGHEARNEAHELGQNINRALNGTTPASSAQNSQAGEKLRRGEEDLRVEGGKAAVKLDRAAMIAKVKAKLATDVGISTITGVDVDTAGQVVTLRGTVSSEQLKEQAEQSALQVTGVTRVVNLLVVKP